MSGPFLDLTLLDGGKCIINMADVSLVARDDTDKYTRIHLNRGYPAREFVTETVDEIYNHPAMVMHRHPLVAANPPPEPGMERWSTYEDGKFKGYIDRSAPEPIPPPDFPCKYTGGCVDLAVCRNSGFCDGITF